MVVRAACTQPVCKMLSHQRLTACRRVQRNIHPCVQCKHLMHVVSLHSTAVTVGLKYLARGRSPHPLSPGRVGTCVRERPVSPMKQLSRWLHSRSLRAARHTPSHTHRSRWWCWVGFGCACDLHPQRCVHLCGELTVHTPKNLLKWGNQPCCLRRHDLLSMSCKHRV